MLLILIILMQDDIKMWTEFMLLKLHTASKYLILSSTYFDKNE